jgi:hypothetical protein
MGFKPAKVSSPSTVDTGPSFADNRNLCELRPRDLSGYVKGPS